jgi:hypothetical protein
MIGLRIGSNIQQVGNVGRGEHRHQTSTSAGSYVSANISGLHG